MSATDFTRELTRYRIDFELIPHRRTETARDEALEIGLAEVVKTIVAVTGGGYVRAVLPAGARLDLHKLSALIGGRGGVRLATEADLAAAYPMFELGAVPPFGGPPDLTVVDRRLALRDWVVLEGGSHDESVRLRAGDLVRLSNAPIGDICED